MKERDNLGDQDINRRRRTATKVTLFQKLTAATPEGTCRRTPTGRKLRRNPGKLKEAT
jgi:hypothetical protein